MKRDMELIRKILLAVEGSPGGWALAELKINGYTEAQTWYHKYLLVDAGLAIGVDMAVDQSPAPEYVLRSLTWAGHEFLDAARDDTRWKRAMKLVEEKGGAVTLGVLQGLLVAAMKSALNLP